MTTIGFVGLGTMGFPMACNLVRGDHVVQGYDIDADACMRFAAFGGRAVASPAAAGHGAEFVITMLPTAKDVRAALFDGGGVIEEMDRHALFIDMSTSHPLEIDAIGRDLARADIAMLDAPVGRTSLNAATGKLLVMVGGAAADLDRARPMLSLMGDTIVHCGRLGMGARMKVINNYMTTATNIITAETLTLCEAAGLDLDLALGVMRDTTASNGHINRTYPAKVLKGDLTPAFGLDLALKDLSTALDLAGTLGVPASTGAAARALYVKAQEAGLGDRDWTVVYSLLRQLTGLTQRQAER